MVRCRVIWTPDRLDRVEALAAQGFGWAAIERIVAREGVPVMPKAGNSVRSALAYFRPQAVKSRIRSRRLHAGWPEAVAEPWDSLIAALVADHALSWAGIGLALEKAGWPGRNAPDAVRAAAQAVAPQAVAARLAVQEEKRAALQQRAEDVAAAAAAGAEVSANGLEEARQERTRAEEACDAHADDLRACGRGYPDAALAAAPTPSVRRRLKTASPRLAAVLQRECRDRKPLPLAAYPVAHTVAHAGVNAGRP